MENWQGAEAKISVIDYHGKNIILKQRIPKNYRIKELDELLCKKRLKTEVRCLQSCLKNNCSVPEVFFTNLLERSIYLEYIYPSLSLKDYLSKNESNAFDVALTVAEQLAKIHQARVIHGDLTTTNILVKNIYNTPQVVIIDFGLAFSSVSIEDRAVDLFVFEKSLLTSVSWHDEKLDLFMKNFIHNYIQEINIESFKDEFVKRYSALKYRGRKKAPLNKKIL